MKIKIEKVVEPSEEIFTVQKIKLREIKNILPNSEIELVGAMAVPMIGRQEVDLMIVSENVEKDSKMLVKNGYRQGPVVNGVSFLKIMVGYVEVAVQIMSPESKMIEIHKKIIDRLKKDEALRKRYEEFKRSLSGLSREEYKKKKSRWIEENIKPII